MQYDGINMIGGEPAKPKVPSKTQALRMWLRIAPDLKPENPETATLKEIAVRMTMDALRRAA